MANPIPLKPGVPAVTMGGDVAAVVPANVGEMMQLADYLAKSEMIPKSYHGKPQEIVVAMMYGMELGLPPLAAVRHVAVINGRPALYGDGQLGVAMGKGMVETIREKIEGEGDQMKAVCSVKRKGMVDPVIHTFSMADAKKAGLWNKAGPWSLYPKRMLQMRARSFALRDAFPDLLLGMSAEESHDAGVGPDHARDVTPSDITPPASRLDAFEATMAGEPEPAPTDATFGLPMEWPDEMADKVEWKAAFERAKKEIEELPDSAACDRWEQVNADGLNILMRLYNVSYQKLGDMLAAKGEVPNG